MTTTIIIIIIIIFLLAFTVSYILTDLVRLLSLQHGILDIPNARSSHQQPTPRGGGMAIVSVTLAGWLAYILLMSPPNWTALKLFLIGAGSIALISGLDDLHPLPSRVRLIWHCLVAGLVVWGVGYWDAIELPVWGQFQLGWFGPAITLLWIIGLTNAYNFMDGIDGLAASQGVVAGLGWAILGGFIGQPLVAMLGLLLAAGSMGFLGFNWAPARVFMGDVGSAFLGYSFAVLPVLAAVSPIVGQPWPGAPLAGVLLVWPFVFDTAFTFVRRWRNGENVLEAHRSHLYQRLTDLRYSHRTITLFYAGLAMLGLVLALSWAANDEADVGVLIILIPLLAGGLWVLVKLFEAIQWGRSQPVMLTPSMGHSPRPFLRNRYLFIADVLALLISPILAMGLRLDGFSGWGRFGQGLLFYIAVALLLRLLIFYQAGLYQRYWQYTNLNDLFLILLAVCAASLVLIVTFVSTQSGLAYYGLALPRTLPLIDALLIGPFILGPRLVLRGIYHYYRRNNLIGGRRVLIIGAGEAGTLVVRELRANPQLDLEPLGFVDDDPAKIGAQIQGLPVLGTSDLIPELARQHQIQQIIIAVPSAPLVRQRELLACCQQSGLTTYSLPGIYELLAGHKTISLLPQVDAQCLLHREPVVTDPSEVAALLAGATVLVTGAGGSIGSELCRQIAGFGPKKILLLGHGENSIFEITLDLSLSFPEIKTQPVIVDVRNAAGVAKIVRKYRPDIIFHTAAHKHVPFMEGHVEEAITNNVLGTRNVLQAAEEHGVARLVLISSDKAVNPTSIMGATKRIAELLVMAAAQRSGRAYLAVRFGNVLGSRGSVLRVFKQQIATGGPLTVTHPEMQRYFMTIPEAVQLVLQASVLGQGGEAFVLDMGEQIRIVDMAYNLIKQCGLERGRDIKVVFTGIRPGEKLYEELFLAGEAYRRTNHPMIFVATPADTTQTEALEVVVTELIALAQRSRHADNNDLMEELLTQVCFYIDRYQPTGEPKQPVVPPPPPSPPRPGLTHLRPSTA